MGFIMFMNVIFVFLFSIDFIGSLLKSFDVWVFIFNRYLIRFL